MISHKFSWVTRLCVAAITLVVWTDAAQRMAGLTLPVESRGMRRARLRSQPHTGSNSIHEDWAGPPAALRAFILTGFHLWKPVSFRDEG